MTSADIAAYQFGSRRAWLAREVAEGKRPLADAERRLRPWLHIAAMAGAKIDAVYQDHIVIFPFEQSGEEVRHPLVLSLSQAQRTAALEELAHARDAAFDAVDRANPEDHAKRLQQARQLALLAHDLAAPPYPVIPAEAGTQSDRDAA